MLDKVTRYRCRQYVRRRLAEMVAPGYPILLDYPLKCSHRYGYGKLLICNIGSWADRVCEAPLSLLLTERPAEPNPRRIHSGSDRTMLGIPEIFQQFGCSRTLWHPVRISAQKVPRRFLLATARHGKRIPTSSIIGRKLS
jgi:hypothetical protein